MSGPIEQISEEVEESDRDKRLLVLLLLVLLVVLGAGIGTFAFQGSGPDGNESTPTPDAVPITPTTPTPTSTPGGGPPAATESGTPTATAVPTATETVDDDRDDDDRDAGGRDRSDSSTGEDSQSVDLRAADGTVLVRASGMAPGHDGRNAVTFENAGDAPGRLLVEDASVVDRENSLLDPETAVGDDDATGELSGALRVRLSVAYADGTTEFLFGGPDRYVTLASLDGAGWASDETLGGGERATVAFEWVLPAATGNEVQSDGAEFDVDFALRQTT